METYLIYQPGSCVRDRLEMDIINSGTVVWTKKELRMRLLFLLHQLKANSVPNGGIFCPEGAVREKEELMKFLQSLDNVATPTNGWGVTARGRMFKVLNFLLRADSWLGKRGQSCTVEPGR